jgi:hypothetical protein
MYQRIALDDIERGHIIAVVSPVDDQGCYNITTGVCFVPFAPISLDLTECRIEYYEMGQQVNLETPDMVIFNMQRSPGIQMFRVRS